MINLHTKCVRRTNVGQISDSSARSTIQQPPRISCVGTIIVPRQIFIRRTEAKKRLSLATKSVRDRGSRPAVLQWVKRSFRFAKYVLRTSARTDRPSKKEARNEVQRDETPGRKKKRIHPIQQRRTKEHFNSAVVGSNLSQSPPPSSPTHAQTTTTAPACHGSRH